MKRLGSVQGGKDDWSTYEWAKYAYEMWIVWKDCSFKELSQKMRRRSRWVAERVKVFQYYPHDEIQESFVDGTFSLTALYHLIGWLEKLEHYKSEIVESFSKDLIRTTMLKKIENKLVKVSDLKNESFIRTSSNEQLKTFLLDPKMKLSGALSEVEGNNTRSKKKELELHQRHIKDTIIYLNNLNIENIEDRKKSLMNIDNIRNEVLKKQLELKTFIEAN
ncbi:MAG: hypothetical protein ACQEXV_19510 [Bacillota bacterium]